LSSPQGLTAYAGDDKLYWADNRSIYRSNLDGSGKEAIFSDLSSPQSTYIHSGIGKLYWADNRSIYRSNLDGSEKEAIFSNLSSPQGLTAYAGDDKLYWADNRSIYRSNLDGSEKEAIFSDLSSPQGLTAAQAVLNVSIVENTAISIRMTGVDSDANDLVFIVDEEPTNGSLSQIVQATNVDSADSATVIYTPPVDYSGQDRFSYYASDGSLSSFMMWVNITVAAVDDGPTATAQSVTGFEDQPLTIELGDPDGLAVTGQIIEAAKKLGNGGLQLNGTSVYAQSANELTMSTGSITLEAWFYPHTNASGDEDKIVQIAGPAYHSAYLGWQDGRVLFGLISGGSDSWYKAWTDPGQVSLNEWHHIAATSDGTMMRVYVDGIEVKSVDMGNIATFSGKVDVGAEVSTASRFTSGWIDEVRVWNRPRTHEEILATRNVELSRPQSGLLFRAPFALDTIALSGTDGEGDVLTYTLASNPSNGSATLSGSTVTYTPSANYNGYDSFTFTVSDGTITSTQSTVSITIDPVNDAPSLAKVGNKTILVDSSLSFSLSGADADGDDLTFLVSGNPSGSVLSNSNFSWIPGHDAVGDYAVTFLTSDGKGGRDSETIMITVRGNSVVEAGDPKFYWTANQSIYRANLDGSTLEEVYRAENYQPMGVTVDQLRKKIYWTELYGSGIYRADINGNSVEKIYVSSTSAPELRPKSLKVDESNGNLYWTEFVSIFRSNLDGSSLEEVYNGGNYAPKYLTLDVEGGKIYWTETYRIYRANLNGTAVEELYSGSPYTPFGVTFDESTRKLFWIENHYSNFRIRSANLDISTVEDVYMGVYLLERPGPLVTSNAVSLDVFDGKIYWTEMLRIYRADMRGTTVEEVYVGSDNYVTGVNIVSLETENVAPTAAPTTATLNSGFPSEIALTGADADGDDLYYLLTKARGKHGSDSRLEDGVASGLVAAGGSTGRGVLVGEGWVESDHRITLDMANEDSGFTFEGWVYPRSESVPNHDYLFSKHHPHIIRVILDSCSNIEFSFYNDTGNQTVWKFDGGLRCDQWSHVAATYDGATMRWYVNGVLVDF
jgi:hypothetical protein